MFQWLNEFTGIFFWYGVMLVGFVTVFGLAAALGIKDIEKTLIYSTIIFLVGAVLYRMLS